MKVKKIWSTINFLEGARRLPDEKIKEPKKSLQYSQYLIFICEHHSSQVDIKSSII